MSAEAPAPFEDCDRRETPRSWLTCVVAVALRQELPDTEIVEVRELELRIGEDRAVYLDTLLEQVARSESEDEAIAHIAAFLAGTLESLGPSEVRPENVRAMLKPEGWARDLGARVGGPPLLARAFGAGVEIVYVLDRATSMRPLTTTDLAALALTEPELHALAMQNLTAELRMPELALVRGRGQVTTLRTEDAYDAARLLVPELWSELARRTDGHLVVAAPARDLVLMVDGRDPEAVRALGAAAVSAFEAGPYEISPALFRFTPEGFVPLDAP